MGKAQPCPGNREYPGQGWRDSSCTQLFLTPGIAAQISAPHPVPNQLWTNPLGMEWDYAQDKAMKHRTILFHGDTATLLLPVCPLNRSPNPSCLPGPPKLPKLPRTLLLGISQIPGIAIPAPLRDKTAWGGDRNLSRRPWLDAVPACHRPAPPPAAPGRGCGAEGSLLILIRSRGALRGCRAAGDLSCASPGGRTGPQPPGRSL